MDFIDLPSIFRDKSVQSSIPNYFKNYDVPIICYKYNKPIRGALKTYEQTFEKEKSVINNHIFIMPLGVLKC